MLDLSPEAPRKRKAGARSCYRCSHLIKATESWELPHIAWWECRAAFAMENLKTFPFLNTKCRKWSKAR